MIHNIVYMYLLHCGRHESQKRLEQKMNPDAEQLQVMLPENSNVAQSRAAVKLNLWIWGLQQENQDRDGSCLTYHPDGAIWIREKKV